jgi:methionyl aminopeptidase
LIVLKSDAEIDAMRPAGALSANILDMIEEYVQPGVSTLEINDIVHEYTIKHGGIPAPLNYKGFPKSVCTSVNEVVCHGIPGKRVLREGDIINVDVTSYLPKVNGFHGDTSATFYVGRPTADARRVVEVARRA